MFKPNIVYKYYGQFTKPMRDLALKPLLDKLTEGRAEILVLPTTRPDVVRDAIRDRFGHFSSPRFQTGAAAELRELQATRLTEPVVWIPGPSRYATRRAPGRWRRPRALPMHTAVTLLPEPGLSSSQALDMATRLPSDILGGPTGVNSEVADLLGKVPAPFGGLLLSAWDELTALDGNSPLLAADDFEERLLELPTSVADAPLWRKVITLWRDILHGIARDQRTVTAWLNKVNAAPEGRVTMDLIDTSSDFERALFCANAVRDPRTLGYAALYYGHYWGMRQCAFAMFPLTL